MSQENVELARRAMESAEAFFGLLDEYVVHYTDRDEALEAVGLRE